MVKVLGFEQRCRSDRAIVAVVEGLLLCQTALVCIGSRKDSPGVDELGHLAAGISHWRFGRFDLYSVNPPLVRMWATLPVELLLHPDVDWAQYRPRRGGRDEFIVGPKLMAHQPEATLSMLRLARLANLPFSWLGLVVCFLWARDLYGPLHGLAAAGLWSLCPNVLAHAMRITPDLGGTALGVCASYLVGRLTDRPSVSRAVLTGVVVALAELAKSTLVILLPVYLAWAAILGWKAGWSGAGRIAGNGALAAVVAWITFLAGYGFEGVFKPLGDFEFISQSLIAARRPEDPGRRLDNRFAGGPLDRLPVPVPKNYHIGIDLQKRDMEGAMPSYLRGEWRTPGWWYYYFYALAVKVPLATWGMASLAAWAAWKRGARRQEFLPVLCALAILLFVSSQDGYTQHLRYVLPAFPFAFILASRSVELVAGAKWWGLAGFAALWSWLAASSLSIYPHSLAYFNEVVGGPKQGDRHLLDSNLDWGQDLLYLRSWYEANPQARPLHLAFNGCYDPALLGIEWIPVPQRTIVDPASRLLTDIQPTLQPGWYAVSVSYLRGRQHSLRVNVEEQIPVGRGAFEYFRGIEPVDQAGYSMRIYYLNEETARELNDVIRARGDPP
jgi:4-amino-4-deoxy-L-arabinose transferase-like glycosyltransferase